MIAFLDNIDSKDFLFLGASAFSFFFAFYANNYFLKNVNNNINKLSSKNLEMNLNQSTIFENLDKDCDLKKHNDFKFEDLNVNLLKNINTNSDFLKNWDYLDMNNVILKIQNANKNEISEIIASNWSFYVFLRLLSNYSEIDFYLLSCSDFSDSLINLLSFLGDMNSFTSDVKIEYNNFSRFNKNILNNYSNESIISLVDILKELKKRGLR